MINMIPPARNYSFYSGFKNRRTRHKLEEINLPAITRYNEQSTENIRFQKTNIRSLSLPPCPFQRRYSFVHSLSIPAMTPAPPPLAPMSPMGPSPVGPLSPARPLSPSRPPSPPKQMTPEQVISPAPVSPLQSKGSPSPNAHQRPPSPSGQAMQSSGSASSTSDTGSDSGSDSSDDSEEETSPPPTKGPSTPPSVSPKNENLIEEPPPAIEEPKSRSWNLESFFNKTNAMPHGEQNSENKQTQVWDVYIYVSLNRFPFSSSIIVASIRLDRSVYR